MDVREKLVELLDDIQVRGEDFTDYEIYGMLLPDTVSNEDVASHLIAHGVTVQEWISVKDRLPKMRDDGFADAFLVTDGSLAHIAYFVDGEWIFTDNGQMKEPMFYDVTHWLCLPQPPKGE